MNKIIQVNLGGYAFTLDEDAYARLSQYLESLKRHFGASPSRDEIVGDIESRLAELLHSKVEGRIVTLRDVDAAIAVMGNPADIADESATTGQAEPAGAAADKAHSPRKRLYRNRDEAVIGGICSGLAAYFGVADPLWFRVGFVISAFFSFGFTFFIYVVLILAVPPARTSAEKLEMRGEPVNVDNIARTFEESAKKFGESFKSEARRMRDSPSFQEGLKNTPGNVADAVMAIVKVILLVLGCGFLFVVGSIWLGFATSFTALFWELEAYIFPSAGLTWLAFISVLLVLGLPLIGILLSLLQMLFKYKPGRWYAMISGGLFVVSLLAIGLVVIVMLRQFKDGAETKRESLILLPESKRIYLDMSAEKGPRRLPGLFHTGDVHFGETEAYFPKTNYHIRASADSVARIVVYRRSLGVTVAEAARLADAIAFEWQQIDEKIVFDKAYRILRGDRWRMQDVEVHIELPVGTTVDYDGNVGRNGSRWSRTLKVEKNTNVGL